MIYEQLKSKNLSARALGSAFGTALDYLKNADFTKLKLDTKYPIGDFGDKMFAQLSEYRTQAKDARKPEQHRDFIDIHYILSGAEVIGVCFDDPRNVVAQEYTKEVEAALYSSVIGEVDLLLTPGSYAVLFPTDIHRPGCMLAQPGPVKKVVIKVAVDLVK